MKTQYPKVIASRGVQFHLLSNAFLVGAEPLNDRRLGSVTIGHLSNLTVEKGALRFIELFRKLRGSGVDVVAVMAGPTADAVVEREIGAASAEFPGAFSWTGPIYGEVKRSFYTGIDVFVFPSSYVNEAQPLVLLEALSFGVAVVTTARGCNECDYTEAAGAVFTDADFDVGAEVWLKRYAAVADRGQVAADAQAHFFKLKASAETSIAALLGEM